MAAPLSSKSDDEYGYDFSLEEETLLSQLITDIPDFTSTHPAATAVASDLGIDTIAEEEFRRHDVPSDDDSFEPSASEKTPLRSTRGRHRAAHAYGTHGKRPRTGLPSSNGDGDVKYPDLSKALSNGDSSSSSSSSKQKEDSLPQPADNTRSPLVRFRSFPKKPFSVSDLTAGAWCELQYFYTLTKLPFGRKTRTAAMKQGTRVHQDLEDQVHTTVHVEVRSKEDGFGLRMWNLIQGLRTLRDAGMTRELEVWGFVDGNLVNGVIDGLSYENPDPEVQEQLSQEAETQTQASITDYFPAKNPAKGKIPQVYLTDVKTRGTLTAPRSPSMLRPAKVQLFLYQRFLSEMAADKLDYLSIFQRYKLDPEKPFSDSFIARVGSLHDELFLDVNSSPDEDPVPPSSCTEPDEASNQPQTSPSDFVKYRTLRELPALLISELKHTFPHGAESVGRLLAIEYRYRGDGSLIDSQVFPMDDGALNMYLGSTMEWWRADREPRGVQIEEAYKCRICEFADNCTWRSAMDDERLQTSKQRLARSRKSASSE